MSISPIVSVFDLIDEVAEVAEARAQAAAGDTIPLADMLRWLDSWGARDELPPPWK